MYRYDVYETIRENIGIWTPIMVRKASNKALADGNITQEQYDELMRLLEESEQNA